MIAVRKIDFTSSSPRTADSVLKIRETDGIKVIHMLCPKLVSCPNAFGRTQTHTGIGQY
jgi:hypothetical protein